MASTGLPGITIHGKSIRVDFMHQGVRYRHVQRGCSFSQFTAD